MTITQLYKKYWNLTTAVNITSAGWVVYFFAAQCRSFLQRQFDDVVMALSISTKLLYNVSV